jgi:hypothetical protein
LDSIFIKKVNLDEDDEYPEYWKKPLHTLLKGCGGCYCQSVAACALFKACGFDTALLIFDSNLGIQIPAMRWHLLSSTMLLRTAIVKRIDSYTTTARQCPGRRMWAMEATAIIKLV